jgi:ankyrin repeat protein
VLLNHHLIDINKKNNQGETAFSLVSCTAEIDLIKTFLKRRELNVNSQCQCAETPLIKAVVENRHEIVKADIVKAILRHSNVNVNAYVQRGEDALSRIIRGYTAKRDSKNSYYSIVDSLLSHPNIQIGYKKFSPLCDACLVGDVRTVKKIIYLLYKNKKFNGGDIYMKYQLNITNTYGLTPLALSIKNGRLEIVRYLLKQKLVNGRLPNYQGKSLLTLAIIENAQKTNTFEMVALLLQHPNIIDFDTADMYGKTPVMYLSDENVTRLVVDHIIKNNLPSQILNQHNKHGRTVLMKACMTRNSKMCRQLLRYPHLDVNAIDFGNNTALMYATRYCDNVLLTNMLLERPEIDINTQNNNGSTALWVAVKDMYYNKNVECLLHHPSLDISSFAVFLHQEGYQEGYHQTILDEHKTLLQTHIDLTRIKLSNIIDDAIYTLVDKTVYEPRVVDIITKFIL